MTAAGKGVFRVFGILIDPFVDGILMHSQLTRHTAGSALAAQLFSLAFYGLPLLAMEIWQAKSGDPLVPLKASRPVRALLYLALFYGIVIFGETHAQSFIYFQF